MQDRETINLFSYSSKLSCLRLAGIIIGWKIIMPILDPHTLDFISSSTDQTVRLGVRLGELMQPGDMICLYGDLGAGKTAISRGIGRGWGTALRVTSPTFTIMNEYPRLKDGAVLYHVDCYRLNTDMDVTTVGLDDIFDGRGAVIIEWPDKIENWLSPDRLAIYISYLNETRRSMQFKAIGSRSEQVLDTFKRNAFGV
ncbi:MAG: tRNA (adenosine(37)-N6)-threonylcarbamoyltransferase complex ATPase subunit type 1 TsaE [Chloroflexi bacterium]|nr:MAG: tRNA (adenosine(37)-N6)-threonylcarbamoyltransferase complex ATPase subunit type 1 TsaE [Chloroflexota bacterium]PIE81605.1 MAG: tRNA (adenosine(37)-N6)-threonylcarbamoyltransferase complex ATPase subunit type 1 TsaE [Chloroflexota bacterium]